MPAKKMRTTIKVEDGEGEVEADRGQEEAGDALREQRRRPNEGAAAAADETRSLRAAHAEAQAQAFRGGAGAGVSRRRRRRRFERWSRRERWGWI